MAFQLGTFIVQLLGDTSHLDAALRGVQGPGVGVVEARQQHVLGAARDAVSSSKDALPLPLSHAVGAGTLGPEHHLVGDGGQQDAVQLLALLAPDLAGG